MSTGTRKRKPNALLGYLKVVWMLFAMLFLLPVWLVRGISTRARFRGELRAAGVPPEAAWRLSNKYKFSFKDFGKARRVANN
jgi:hypothetical protein